MQAMESFEAGQKNGEIATALRISERSVERWRRAWRERGAAGLLSRGSPGRPRLSAAQIARLERELERGPLVHGWADQRWTLTRIKTLIGRLFHVTYTVEGAWRLLKRHGWSWQQPTRRAISATTARSRCGRRRPGRGQEDRGGARCLDRLRGRGWAVDVSAACQDLGSDRSDSGRAGARPGLWASIDGGDDLLQARRAIQADLRDP